MFKSKAYQNRMDILLSDPEILKKMVEITKKEKEEKNRNNNLNNNSINSSSKKTSSIKEKVSFKQTLHQIKLQTDNIKEEDISNKVNNILNQEQPIKSMKNILNDELNKQDKWKLRFAQKKKLLSKKINITNEGEINIVKSKSGDINNFINSNINDFQKNISIEEENKNEESIKQDNKNEEMIKDENKNEEIIKQQNEIIENKNENNMKEIDEINTNKKEVQIESKKEKVDDVKKIEADENIKNTINEKLKHLDNLINESRK